MQKNLHRKFLLCCISFFLSSISYSQSQKPNIIYILADDLGYGDVSSLNKNSKLHTTNIDLIAKSGMRFTDAHSNSAVCTPTRYGILTGRYAWRTHLQTGVLWSYDSALISSDRTTVATLLRNTGYHTSCIGKWHLGLDWAKDKNGKIDITQKITNGPNQIGFDYFYGITSSLDIPPYCYIRNDKITATSIDSIPAANGKGFWRAGPIGNDFKHAEVLPNIIQHAESYIAKEAKSGSPFFLYLALPAPHTPILPSKEFLGKSGTNEYGDFVLMIDAMIGKILSAVKEAGIENNTIIFFTSDNGCSPSADFAELSKAGHYPSYVFRGEKADIYEGGHRIPFIVKWPGHIKAGSQCNRTICLTDLMATVAAITSQKITDGEAEDSYDLLPLLLQKGKYQRTNIIHHSIEGNFAIRQDNWKLVYAYGSGGWSAPIESNAKKGQLPPIQLFDIEKDTAEKNNLAMSHPEIVKKLTITLKQLVDNGRSTPGKKQKNDAPVDYLKYE